MLIPADRRPRRTNQDAPRVPPESISVYGMKRAADDIAELAKAVGAEQIILGGHDWGGFTVYRVALWHPHLVKGIFAVCTPYNPPHRHFNPLDAIVARAPQFGYQKQLAGTELEAALKDPQSIRAFLLAMYGGRPAKGGYAFTPEHGIDLGALSSGIGSSPVIADDVVDYYVEQFSRSGMHGPCKLSVSSETSIHVVADSLLLHSQ